MTAKKILILYTSIGQGHKSIAENIGFWLSDAGYEVILEDAHKVESGGLARGSTKLYGFIINKLPFLWQWFHDTSWFISATLPLRLWVASRNYQKTLKVLDELKPELVISVQVTPSGILAYLKKKNLYQGKFGIAFSDFHLHRYWLYEPQADFYLANTEEQKQEMIRLGVIGEKIFVIGMTLKPPVQVDVAAVRQKLNIQPNDKVVLMGSGSLGTGLNEGLVAQLIKQPNVKVIMPCGKNEEFFKKMSEVYLGTNAIILGFYTPMDELYAITDIYITKPGGLSSSEALRWYIPILVSHFLPGGERHNYDYLMERGLIMPEPINMVSEALEELETGGFRNALKESSELPKLFNGKEILIEAVNRAIGK